MVNSTWTSNHINQLWKRDDASILFPPCAVTELLAAIPSTVDSKREKILLCIAQFRPEKSHSVLIKSFAKFMAKTKEHKDAKLVLVGSVRNSEDATRVYDLRLLAHELGVRDNVIFVTDAPWSDVLDWLKRAWAGVNGMWNEHFGIGVVEYQAAGLVGVVHKSGGPYLDIYKDDCGVHCLDEEEFAAGFEKVLGMDEETIKEWRDNARKSARRFDEETFEKGWEKEMQMLGLGERKE